MKSLGCAFALSLTILACGKSRTDASPASSSSAAPAASSQARGLDASENDATLVVAAKKARDECASGWDDARGFDPACPAYKTWTEQKIDAQAEPTLVRFLEDGDVRVRLLGAAALARGAAAYRKDDALAASVARAAEEEGATAAAGALGYLASRLDAGRGGMGDTIDALAKAPHPAILRGGVVSYLLDANRESDRAYDITKSVAQHDEDAATRKHALESFGAVYAKHTDEICALWTDAFEHDADDAVAASMAAHLTRGLRGYSFSAPGVNVASGGTADPNMCTTQVELVLRRTEERAKAGKIKHGEYIDGLRGVLADPHATVAQKQRTSAIARAIASGKDNDAVARVAALYFLRDRDPDARAFAKKFVDDPQLSYVAKLLSAAAKP